MLDSTLEFTPASSLTVETSCFQTLPPSRCGPLRSCSAPRPSDFKSRHRDCIKERRPLNFLRANSCENEATQPSSPTCDQCLHYNRSALEPARLTPTRFHGRLLLHLDLLSILSAQLASPVKAAVLAPTSTSAGRRLNEMTMVMACLTYKKVRALYTAYLSSTKLQSLLQTTVCEG